MVLGAIFLFLGFTLQPLANAAITLPGGDGYFKKCNIVGGYQNGAFIIGKNGHLFLLNGADSRVKKKEIGGAEGDFLEFESPINPEDPDDKAKSIVRYRLAVKNADKFSKPTSLTTEYFVKKSGEEKLTQIGEKNLIQFSYGKNGCEVGRLLTGTPKAPGDTKTIQFDKNLCAELQKQIDTIQSCGPAIDRARKLISDFSAKVGKEGLRFDPRMSDQGDTKLNSREVVNQMSRGIQDIFQAQGVCELKKILFGEKALGDIKFDDEAAPDGASQKAN